LHFGRDRCRRSALDGLHSEVRLFSSGPGRSHRTR
jgi:hypothetical protein